MSRYVSVRDDLVSPFFNTKETVRVSLPLGDCSKGVTRSYDDETR